MNLSTSIESIHNSLPNRDACIKFLNIIKYCKDPGMRLFSWMKILHGDDFEINEDKVRKMYKSYQGYLNDVGDDPLSKVDKKEGFVIKADVDRSLSHYKMLGAEIGLTEDDMSEGCDAAAKILVILSLKYGLKYIQGYDRYVYLVYLLSLSYTTQINEERSLAEMFTVEICQKFLKIVNFKKFLDRPDDLEKYFDNCDKRIKEELPKKNKCSYEVIQKNNCKSILFGVKWRLLLFSDENDAKGTFLVFDSFISHSGNEKEFEKHFEDLFIGHLKEININSSNNIYETIQQKRFLGKNILKTLQNTKKLEYESSSDFVNLIFFIIMIFVIIYLRHLITPK